jgi:hypothetical protein
MQEITERKSGSPPERIVAGEDMPGGKDKTVRRTRGPAPLLAGGANGQRTNGHATPVAERDRSGANGHGKRSGPNGKAASDDASGTPAAMAANSAAAGTAHEACADVAQPSNTQPQLNAATAAGPRASGEVTEIPPGSEALPEDGISFVDAMHERIDLWEVGKNLMHAKDEKIVQRAWERLLEMKYGKGQSATGDEIPQIIIDTPRPVRD